MMLRALWMAGAAMLVVAPRGFAAPPADAFPSADAVWSPDKIAAAVRSLHKQDVPWRRIEWETCLLDGLQTSREQNNPVVLWIFIDRPIDDERC